MIGPLDSLRVYADVFSFVIYSIFKTLSRIMKAFSAVKLATGLELKFLNASWSSRVTSLSIQSEIGYVIGFPILRLSLLLMGGNTLVSTLGLREFARRSSRVLISTATLPSTSRP